MTETIATKSTFKTQVTKWFEGLQAHICNELEKADGKQTFLKDDWKREAGGGGRTCILQEGAVIEKGGVAFSAVFGKTPDKILRALHLPESDFYATGVSIVIHPNSPMIPIIHMNVRYFEMSNGTAWFGGGIDLTPHYVDKDDAVYFHQALKNVCDKFNPSYYPEFKKWADDYFYIKHRRETRGIGGIFFDRLSETKLSDTGTISMEERFEFVKEIGLLFPKIYTYFMNKNKNIPFGAQEKEWQTLRRGRYVEFNLIYDKGTKFGLDTDGRTESILMSMPPQANWKYNFTPSPDSKEAQTLALLKKNINWLT
jgi:coproporphyrinogen III oxidase